MKLYYTDHFELPLPAGHRFPMAKYRMLRDRVVADPVHAHDVLLVPLAASLEQLSLAHDAENVRRVVAGELSHAEIDRQASCTKTAIRRLTTHTSRKFY